ncbi:AIPR family protein [Pararhizobium arenae]|uniref:AIPR family protein n=1 Tax=Pararhizobium arenae TaxID=1856850 RepID=UPI00094ACE2B|nr:AIPR family protein [Pararhizobium arenae]
MAPKLVPQTPATIIDFGVVETGIRERETSEVSRGVAFAKLVTETIFCVSRNEVEEHIVDGGADRGIDIIYIDHNSRRINIGSCKTVLDFKNSHKSFPAEEIDKIISFIDDILLHRDDILQNCNGKLSSKIREIWEIFATEAYDVAVHIFSNKSTLAKDARQRLANSLGRHNISLFEYGLFELSHGLVKATKPRFKKTLKCGNSGTNAIEDAGRRALIARVNLDDLARFLTGETGAFDERLVWQNVRYFLGLENEVNREIRASLINDRLEDFWFLNSGLTIVCEQILSNPNGAHPIHMVNPQIVNGCQTASVIQSVHSETLRSLKDGFIQVKIIETNSPEFVERIALASNTQSRILGRDLRAHDIFQLQIAECLRSRGYFYCRKRGERSPTNKLISLDSARVGQLMLAYVCGEPTKSKTNSNDIFGDLYAEAFNPLATTPDIIISAHETHVEIEKRRQEAIHWQSSITRSSYEESWIIEGHFHVLFVVGELLRRSGKSLADKDSAVALIDTAVSAVQKFVHANKGTASYRLFRLATSREGLLKLLDGDNDRPSFSYPQQLSMDWN